jgi:hypothetical protein
LLGGTCVGARRGSQNIGLNRDPHCLLQPLRSGLGRWDAIRRRVRYIRGGLGGLGAARWPRLHQPGANQGAYQSQWGSSCPRYIASSAHVVAAGGELVWITALVLGSAAPKRFISASKVPMVMLSWLVRVIAQGPQYRSHVHV